MRPRALLAVLVAVALAAVCARLGAWQHSRWNEKRRLNAASRLANASAALELRATREITPSLVSRAVVVEGTFESAWHLLISDRWWKDQPGVEVMTPMRLTHGGVLLVDRGWLPAADAITARPQDHPEPGVRRVTGVLVAPRRPQRAGAWEALARGDTVVWSARALDVDSVRARLGQELAPLVLRALPGPEAPASPVRLPPEPEAEGMHLAYTVQWYLFAAALVAGAGVVVTRERASRPARGRPGASAST